MRLWSSADKAAAATVGISVTILAILICVDSSGPDWLPQVVVSLAGFAGASWFVRRRLDLLDKGISATERANLNGAVKEAVNMLSDKSLTSVLAGQRWLHQIASVDQEQAELVRALLCSYIASSGQSPNDDTLDDESRIKTRQSALNLLFGDSNKERYSGCEDAADLGSVQWGGLNFAGLDLTNTIFSKGVFTGAGITGACFDGSNLRETEWAGPFGDNTRTRMDNVDMRSVSASSCTFRNISFRGAKMGTDGPQSGFKHCTFENCDFRDADWTGAFSDHCTFKNCDFRGADWTGAFFDTPEFDYQCKGVTFELCASAKLKEPSGLSGEVHAQLDQKGLL